MKTHYVKVRNNHFEIMLYSKENRSYKESAYIIDYVKGSPMFINSAGPTDSDVKIITPLSLKKNTNLIKHFKIK